MSISPGLSGGIKLCSLIRRLRMPEVSVRSISELHGGWRHGYLEPVVRWDRDFGWHPDFGRDYTASHRQSRPPRQLLRALPYRMNVRIRRKLWCTAKE